MEKHRQRPYRQLPAVSEKRNLDQRGGGCQLARRETHKDYTASLQLADTQPQHCLLGQRERRTREREEERGRK